MKLLGPKNRARRRRALNSKPKKPSPAPPTNCKIHAQWSLLAFVTVTAAMTTLLLHRRFWETGELIHEFAAPSDTQSSRRSQSSKPYVSMVILTYKRHDLFGILLQSILQQKGNYFDVLIVDSGCRPETKQVIASYLEDPMLNTKNIAHKYLEACDNPGYAIVNNRAVEQLDSKSSKWLLFLNDDIAMQGNDFLENMMDVVESHQTEAVGSGCVMKNSDGSSLIESGSILFQDASATGFGRGRTDFDAPELSYPRPVDYVSGACLLVSKKVFKDYGGFDSKTFPSYYEDTDLQMHIQHTLGKQIWLSPKSIAHHAEHASFGSNNAKQLMQKSQKLFVEKWNHKLLHHIPNPIWKRYLSGFEKKTALLKASDTRGRDPRAANIFYFDAYIPCRNIGAGYPRSVDNIKMLIELGHRVTVASTLRGTIEEECLDKLRGIGAEVIPPGIGKAFEIIMARQGFYEVLIVSRSETFERSYAMWRDYLKNNPLAIVFDSEALTYRRDVKRMKLLQEDGIRFPSLGQLNPNRHRWRKLEQKYAHLRAIEEQLIEISDITITVSEGEKKIARETVPNVTSIEVIGHVIEPRVITNVVPFQDRKGILFFARFGGMYYNGDAIWYFLKEAYPKILEETPIPLTIAGKRIPDELREFTKTNGLDRHVKFLESVKDISSLYDSHRVFVAPHLYGSGIQYKLSESLAMGIVTVMSRLSADAFGLTPEDEVSCIGEDPNAFSRCVIRLHSNESAWTKMQQKGFQFIEKTHNQDHVKNTWAKIIDDAKDIQGRARRCRSEGNQQEERVCTCDNPPGHCKIFEKPELA